jgi:Rrf2 family protein
MKLSNKAGYALHAMLNVASKEGEKNLCSINSIAREENIPREYLAKILKELTQMGFLKSYKGIFGGYKLAKARGDISVLSIMEAMEGPFLLSSCNWSEAQKKGFHRKGDCAAAPFFKNLQDRLRTELAGITLDKLDYGNYSSTVKGRLRGRA